MDGVHDLGGLHGFGPIPISADEALFTHRWEGRVWAMLGTIMSRTTIDRFRFTIEQMPPGEYLNARYYERWLWAIERLAAEQGLMSGGDPPPRVTFPRPPLPKMPGRFHPDERVRVANAITSGHTRVPRYLRRHTGRVEQIACAWPNPGESAASGTYGEPELVYTVAFAASDVFGSDADHTITADLGESDLQAA